MSVVRRFTLIVHLLFYTVALFIIVIDVEQTLKNTQILHRNLPNKALTVMSALKPSLCVV